MTRQFSHALVAITAAIGLLSTASASCAQQKNPNVLIIWGGEISQFNVGA